MRIGFDAKRAFFNHSGLGNYSRTLISQMCRLFPENEYFLFSPKKKPDPGFDPPANTITVAPETFPYKNFPSLWRSVYMGTEILNRKIQIFHGLSNELPLNIKKSNARSVVTIHDLIFLRYPDLYKSTDRYLYEKKFRQSCRNADAIVAISGQTKRDIMLFCGINPDKIHVIYQDCNPAYYTRTSEEVKDSVRKKYALPGNYLLYVGTIEERKNLLQLIKARHQYKIPLPLVVVGRQTPYYEKVRDYILRYNIKDVFFLKNIQQSELPAIYQMSEMLVYPSSFEGFGIPILEALNSGVPVITGTGGCMQETGGKHSIYVDPKQLADIAESIFLVMNDPEQRKIMIEEGYKHALQFREEHTSNEMMKLYLELI